MAGPPHDAKGRLRGVKTQLRGLRLPTGCFGGGHDHIILRVNTDECVGKSIYIEKYTDQRMLNNLQFHPRPVSTYFLFSRLTVSSLILTKMTPRQQ